MANIGFIQHRLGRTDGVSLEVDKIREVLERNGHRVHYCAGNEDVPGGQRVPELYPFHPVTKRILLNATRELRDDASPEALMDDVRAHAERVKPGFVRFIRDNELDLVFEQHVPPVAPNVRHLVINRIAQDELRRARARDGARRGAPLRHGASRALPAGPRRVSRSGGPQPRARTRERYSFEALEAILAEILAENGLRLRVEA